MKNPQASRNHATVEEYWKLSKPFNLARRAPAAVAHKGYLYILGGVDPAGRYIQTVEYSKIMEDGNPEQWKLTSPINEGRFYLATAALNGYIYALGGGAGSLGEDNYPVATVEKAKILPDGSLGPWQFETPLSTPRRGLKAEAYKDKVIFATGGYNGQFLKSVEHSEAGSDGRLSPWTLDPQLSKTDRYIHSSALHNKQLYLLGGHVQKNKMSYGDVEMTRITDNYLLSEWFIQSSHLLEPRFIASAFAAKGHLYIVGGHNGAKRLQSVEVAPIKQSGLIEQWRFTANLKKPRSAAAIAHTEEYVYILGGMDNNSVLNSVEYTQIHRNGRLGFKVLPARKTLVTH